MTNIANKTIVGYFRIACLIECLNVTQTYIKQTM
jgi:hypothetical protein